MPRRLSVNNGRGQWACADPGTCSLYPVPPSQSRKKLYCPQCPFDWNESGCLFAPTYPLRKQQHSKDRKRKRLTKARAQGLNESGQPLTECCWNCVRIREVSGGYTCELKPASVPAPRGALVHRTVAKTGCTSFEMRLTLDIPRLVPSAVGMVPTPPF